MTTLRVGVIMYQTSFTKGQELVAQRMVKELRRQGHEAFLITSIYHDGEPAGLSSADAKIRGGYVHAFDKALGIPVIRLSSEGASWPPRRIAFEDFVGILTRIVDELNLNVLITHSTLWNGPEEVVKFVRWRRNMIAGGAPYHHIVFCHMSHFQEPSDGRYAIHERSYRETWNATVLPQITQDADIILVTTPYEAEFMKRFGARNEKMMLFPGGIEDRETASAGDARAFGTRYGLRAGTKMVSCLGTVEERKNQLALLEVAKTLSELRRDVHFVIAGRIDGGYGDAVKKEASRLENVSVVGPLSEKDKAGLIRASFANITLSRSESLGIAQLEFMSAGVPVITSGVGGQSWIVRDGFNGVVLKGPDDVEGAADAIVVLADDLSKRKKLGRNAARSASGFSISSLVRALSERLETEVRKYPDAIPFSQRISGEEKVVEALTDGVQNVAATSKRLIIKSAVRGTKAIIIPYNEISKIVRYIKAPWPVLGVGIAATLLLLSQRILGLRLVSRFLEPVILSAFSRVGLGVLTPTLVTVLPFLPFLVATTAFTLMLRQGFLILYGPAKSKIFLPKSFGKVLRIADKLTPNKLFAEEGR